MTTTTDVPEELTDDAPSRLRAVLIGVLIAAMLAIVGSGGYLLGHNGSSGQHAAPGASSVDAGFAWDMTTHHLQAVSMAGFVRDHTTDPLIKNLAYDIETSQFNQVGQMQGWLDVWGLPTTNPNPQMTWMAASGHNHLSANGLMPGMATQAELARLQSLTGPALDVYFLQLMLRHHQGGLPMVQWAADHAAQPYVRNSAQKMADSQSGEVLLMEQMLRERGASPLPPPS